MGFAIARQDARVNALQARPILRLLAIFRGLLEVADRQRPLDRGAGPH
jgi:hypothetical protein